MTNHKMILLAQKKSLLTILAVIGFQAISCGQDQIQPVALDKLVAAAQKSHSDALIIWQDGKVIGEWHFGKSAQPIEAMSVTKSVVNLAIGKLITDGRIKSVDQPVWEFYPEWKQGRKKNITIKHLLNHTSGLQNLSRADVEIYPSPDFVQLALAAELTDEPGAGFSYNNKAVNLLAGIVQKASGERMDLYIRKTLFTPLGITNFTWSVDRAGNPHAMSGLQIQPDDLAKIGQLVLNRGKWNHGQLIAESWFDLSLQPGQEYNPRCGLLWWLIPDHFSLRVDDEQIGKLAAKAAHSPSSLSNLVAKAENMKGWYEDSRAYYNTLMKVFGSLPNDPLLEDLPKIQFGKIIGWSAEGYLGQFLVIIPEAKLVAVRMVAWRNDYDQATDGFSNFQGMVLNIVNTNGVTESKK